MLLDARTGTIVMITKQIVRCNIIFSLLFSLSVFSDDALNADKVYESVVDNYKYMKTYCDKGVATSKTDADYITFSTSYAKSEEFIFTFIKPHPYSLLSFLKDTFVLHQKGDNVEFRENSSVEQAESIYRLIGSTAGISFQSSTLIPSLLLEEGIGGGIHRLINPRLVGSKLIDGHMCSILELERRKGSKVILFVCEKYIIREIETEDFVVKYLEVSWAKGD